MAYNEYLQAVTKMYIALEESFQANENLMYATHAVWNQDGNMLSKSLVGDLSIYPDLPPSPPPENEECEICGNSPQTDSEGIHEANFCSDGRCWECTETMHNAMNYCSMAEEFAYADHYGGENGIHLLVLRLYIASARKAWETTWDKKWLNREEFLSARADKILTQIPEHFKPWWKDRFIYEKHDEILKERKKESWNMPVDKPFSLRLAAELVKEQQAKFAITDELTKMIGDHTTHIAALKSENARLQNEISNANRF